MIRTCFFVACIMTGAPTLVVAQADNMEMSKAQASVEKGIKSFSDRFVENAPELTVSMITNCKLVSDMATMSALKEYGQNPRVTDSLMLVLNGQMRGWTELYNLKSAAGNDMNAGPVYDAFSAESPDMENALVLTSKYIKSCGELFQEAQVVGLEREESQ